MFIYIIYAWLSVASSTAPARDKFVIACENLTDCSDKIAKYESLLTVERYHVYRAGYLNGISPKS